MTVRVEIERIGTHGLPHPTYATAGAAGMDLCACLAAPMTLPPMGRAVVPSGFRVAIPEGFELQVRPRSGLALRHGISMPNSPGTIDSDYRGELGVLLVNLGPEPFTISHGDRIAQAVLVPVARCVWAEVAELPATARGAGGFGSTGT